MAHLEEGWRDPVHTHTGHALCLEHAYYDMNIQYYDMNMQYYDMNIQYYNTNIQYYDMNIQYYTAINLYSISHIATHILDYTSLGFDRWPLSLKQTFPPRLGSSSVMKSLLGLATQVSFK